MSTLTRATKEEDECIYSRLKTHRGGINKNKLTPVVCVCVCVCVFVSGLFSAVHYYSYYIE